jgi:hypothetical protein
VDFAISHVFAAGPDDVARALLDEDYQRSLEGVGPLRERSLLSQTSDSDGTVERRVRCVLQIELGGVARTFIGNGEPAWVEHATWDPQAMRWTWTIHPEVAADLLSADGTIELQPSGEGTARVVTGDVAVKVPLYGGKVEGWIVDGLTKAYDEEAERLAAWLAR